MRQRNRTISATQIVGADIELKTAMSAMLQLAGQYCGGPIVLPNSCYSCATCYFQMLKDDGIWRALPPKRASYFQKFMREYQTVREAEGRGSNNPQYYLAAAVQRPLRHITRSNGRSERAAIASLSTRYCRQSSPEPRRNLNILDLGAGNGWMSYRLALRGHLPVAVDLLSSELDGLAAATHYHKKFRRPVPAISGGARPPAFRR